MKIFSFKSLLAVAATFLTIASAWGVPARPALTTIVQEDGTELTVRRVGDEHGHVTFTEDGYLLAPEGNLFYYATLDTDGNPVSTGIRASQIADRSEVAVRFLATADRDAVRHMATAALSRRRAVSRKAPARVPASMLTNNFPSTGKQKALVVLVEYKDVKFRLDDPYDYFSRMLNENGFSSYGGTGCAHEYFLECSGGKFDPEFDIYGPITLSQKMSYYGGNDWSGNDKNADQMAVEACQQLDDTVDFSEYDRDGDGKIDNVFVIYAGQGEAGYGTPDTVWPHAWEIFGGAGLTYRFDGVLLDHYGCTNEWEENKPDGVGTFIHEFSHVMGLPDLYVTDYDAENFTPSEWSVLDVGPYNNDGRTPPLYSAFERMSMGWMTPEPITGEADITLLPVSSNTAYYIPTAKSNEFFLLENRQQESWDKYLPGHGMLVWHVDYNTSAWANNTLNNTQDHPRVAIEAAGGAKFYYTTYGTKVYEGSSSDPFPGTKQKTSFTDETVPSMQSWNGQGQEKPVTLIEEKDGIVSFVVSGGAASPLPTPVALDAAEVAGTRFVARWNPVAGAESYILAVTTDGQEIPTYIPVKDASAWEISGLVPETEYRYRVAARAANQSTGFSDEIKVETTTPSLGDRAVKAIDATGIDGSSFTANWEAVDGATGYELSVNLYNPPSAYNFTALFDGSVPEGWESDCDNYNSTSSLSGILLDKDGAYVSTGVIDAGVKSCTFKHYGMGAASLSNTLSVWALDGDKWIKIGNTYPNIATTTYTVKGIPDDCRGIKVTYTMSKNAPVIIGEFTISGGTDDDSSEPLSGYQDRPVGDVTSFNVTGLKPLAHYTYTVVATDDDGMRSARSNTVVVKTSPLSGIRVPDASSVSAVTVVAGGICIGGDAAWVTVCDAVGRTVYSGPTGTVELPAGFYIVDIPGSSAVKVIVK